MAAKLGKIGIETIKDLIFYYPFRYEDYSRLSPINRLEAGMTVTAKGKITLIKNSRSPRKRKIITEAIVEDDTDQIKTVWFNQPWIAKNVKAGDEVYLSGKIVGDLFNAYFYSPNYEKVSAFTTNTARLVPIYSLTEGVTNKQLRFLMKTAVGLAGEAEDHLPPEIKKKNNLADLAWSLKTIHFPEDNRALSIAKKRLSFDELFFPQLWSQLLKRKLKEKKSPTISFHQDETKELLGRLDFELTADQKKAAWQIIKDLQKDEPMNRLLDGDVGSGKTLVAAIAAYNTVLSGCQAIFMAPTEILARQHFLTLSGLLGSNRPKIGLVTGSRRIIGDEPVAKKEFWRCAQAGEIDIIVGTHALIQEGADFGRLGLVVVDEQHRFGVEQRQLLKEKSVLTPHFLSLTATPIPRTLALAFYGDLDLSVIRQSPKGRKKIITRVVPADKRRLAYEFILKQINSGRQVFVICPLIDPSDRLGVRSVTEEFERLDKNVFPDLKIGLLHGRLKSVEKERVMAEFVENKIKILVSTSVVEVGIDVPNATVMMIEGAERFGLAQLHQFRGRVGRGEYQSYCFLFSDNSGREQIDRLEIMTNCYDGFALAQKDLELRGAGKIYGLEQSGFSDFKIADISDLDMLATVRSAVRDFLERYDIDDRPAVKERLEKYNFVEHLE